jgi:hypothetical protein
MQAITNTKITTQYKQGERKTPNSQSGIGVSVGGTWVGVGDKTGFSDGPIVGICDDIDDDGRMVDTEVGEEMSKISNE